MTLGEAGTKSIVTASFTDFFGTQHEVPITLEAAGGSPTHVLMVNSGTDNTSKNQNVIFDMQGRKVGTKQEWESLPSGIYIINGLKAVR